MISPKAPTRMPAIGMPSRHEGLLSLLIASPMTLLGCTPDEPQVDSEGSSSGPGTTGGSGSTSGADSSSTGGASTGGSTGSSGTTDGTTMGVLDSSSTSDVSTSSGGTTSESTSDGEGSTSTGGEQGNTCERVGDLFDMCFGGGYYYNWYEYSCNNYINYYISIGDIECAQAHNEIYACIADLDCAELGMGAWQACETQYDNMYSICYDWEDTFGGSYGDTFGFEDSGIGFIVGSESGGGFIGGSDGGGFIVGTSDGGWGGST